MQLKFFDSDVRSEQDQGLHDPEKGHTHPDPARQRFIAIDYGFGSKLMVSEDGDAVFSPGSDVHGVILDAFGRGLDVVTESSTIGSMVTIDADAPLGSFGVSPQRVQAMLEEFPDRKILLVPTRITHRTWAIAREKLKREEDEAKGIEYKTRKQRRKEREAEWKEQHPDLKMPRDERDKIPDDEAVRTIWRIAADGRQHLRRWALLKERPRRETKRFIQLRHHKYPRSLMRSIKEVLQRVILSEEEIRVLSDGDGIKFSDTRTAIFVCALIEDGSATRAGFEQVIGLYAHGYPSVYRSELQRYCWAARDDNPDAKEILWKSENGRSGKSRFRRALRGLYHKLKPYRDDLRTLLLGTKSP